MKYLFFIDFVAFIEFWYCINSYYAMGFNITPFYLKKVFYPFLSVVIFLILVTILNFVFFDFKVSGVLNLH